MLLEAIRNLDLKSFDEKDKDGSASDSGKESVPEEAELISEKPVVDDQKKRIYEFWKVSKDEKVQYKDNLKSVADELVYDPTTCDT